jgi:VIT1/CCC1 family predicted Fe2+/Mn2+ transporter
MLRPGPIGKGNPTPALKSPRRRIFDRELFPELVTATNDGIIATAAIVEGLTASAVSGNIIVLAGLATLAAGGLSLGGVIYAEYAAERDDLRSTLDQERRLLASLPDAELEELKGLYVARGLTAELAAQVAAQLTARDALSAHVEAEYGISTDDLSVHPLPVAVASGMAFAVGALVPLLAVWFAPTAWRVPVIFAAAIAGLCVTSVVRARVGRSSVLRTFGRAVTVGVSAMLIGLVLGRLVG